MKKREEEFVEELDKEVEKSIVNITRQPTNK